jgi:hypothetical protein
MELYETKSSGFCKRNKEHCEILCYGSLLKGLQNTGIWPRPKAQDVHISVNQLSSALNGCKIYTLNNHTDCFCTSKIRKYVGSVISSLESPLLDSHRQQLRARSQEGKEHESSALDTILESPRATAQWKQSILGRMLHGKMFSSGGKK